MSLIEIRDVPDDLQRTLETRAARAGKSLSAYLLDQIRESAEHPTLEEFLDKVRQLPPIKPAIDPVEIIREHRDRS